MNDLKLLSRTELTRAACDAIAADGRKPSLGLVREWTIQNAGAKKGSDGDVQKDVNDWFVDLLKLKRDHAVADLPDAVASAARAFWRIATEAAADNLAAARLEAETRVLAANTKIIEAEARTTTALARSNEIGHELDIAKESIRRLEASAAEQKAIAAATEERRAAQIQARDERIADLVSDLGREEAERAAIAVEIAGIRKYALLQVEEARLQSRHWKSEYDRSESASEAYRNKTSAFETQLATARGRLSGVEEALAAAVARSELLEGELASTMTAVVAKGTVKHRLAATGRIKMVSRRRKL